MQVYVRKRLARRLTYLWPGLPRLWWQGSFAGLAVATAFAALLNFLLLSTFIWSEPTAEIYLYSGWGLVATFWVVAAAKAISDDRRSTQTPSELPDEALFLDAQTEYLRGHWFKAEQLLQGILESYPTDAESRLLLATLYRHTDRPELAKRQLQVLERGEGFAKWRMEIDQEKLLLKEVADNDPADEVNSAEAA